MTCWPDVRMPEMPESTVEITGPEPWMVEGAANEVSGSIIMAF